MQGLSKSINWVKTTFKTLLAVSAAYYVTFSVTVKSEHKLSNSITVYEQITAAVTALNKVINQYLSLWEDNNNIADVLKNEWIEILLLDNWKDLYKSDQVKVYLLGTKDCDLINEAFDKLHKQGCMIWITQSTPFTYLCFVVWKITLTDQKGCVVVDIWALNWITMFDTYSVSSQVNILTAVQGVSYIFTVNCAFFFYQWWVKSQDCHKLTVSSHWG